MTVATVLLLVLLILGIVFTVTRQVGIVIGCLYVALVAVMLWSAYGGGGRIG